MKKCQIFVCYHKKYPLIEGNCLFPIHAGKELSTLDLGLTGDDTGHHISAKNLYFCELTVLYWIWKNVQARVVGLCHYRRFLNLNNSETKVHKITDSLSAFLGLNEEKIMSYMNENDIILPFKKGARKNPETLYQYYKREHDIQDVNRVLKIIQKKYPDQYQTAYRIWHQETKGYYANMLIARKNVFDDYAAWLFDILFALEKEIQSDVEKRSIYQQRVYGFLSERLLTVYIALHPEIRVKEVPMVFVEEDLKKWWRYQIRNFKRRVLKRIRRQND